MTLASFAPLHHSNRSATKVLVLSQATFIFPNAELVVGRFLRPAIGAAGKYRPAANTASSMLVSTYNNEIGTTTTKKRHSQPGCSWK
jgi:hypothetical protein